MKKETAIRFSVSLSEELLEQYDRLLEKKGYSNRSEGIRDLLRDALVEEEIQGDQVIVGVISLVYDHHVRELTNKLIDMQHESESEVITSMHVHLDHHNCLEVILVRGKSSVVKPFADALIGTRGVKHGRFVVTSTGSHLPR